MRRRRRKKRDGEKEREREKEKRKREGEDEGRKGRVITAVTMADFKVRGRGKKGGKGGTKARSPASALVRRFLLRG